MMATTRDCVRRATPINLLLGRKRAGVAQSVERQFCKLRVGGSSPSASSNLTGILPNDRVIAPNRRPGSI